MKFLILFFFAAGAFANDPIVEKLNEENNALKKQIDYNNQVIGARKNSSFKTAGRTEEDEGKNSILSLGIERIVWGEEVNGSAPTIGFSHMIGKVGLEASYGRLLFGGYPAAGTQTLINATRISAKYDFQTPIEGLSLQPVMGYVLYSVSSPNAGHSGNPYTNERELREVQAMEDRSGFFTGLAISKTFGKNWVGTIRGDFLLSTTLQLGYRI